MDKTDSSSTPPLNPAVRAKEPLQETPDLSSYSQGWTAPPVISRGTVSFSKSNVSKRIAGGVGGGTVSGFVGTLVGFEVGVSVGAPTGSSHTPPSQNPPQHSAFTAHPFPFAAQPHTSLLFRLHPVPRVHLSINSAPLHSLPPAESHTPTASSNVLSLKQAGRFDSPKTPGMVRHLRGHPSPEFSVQHRTPAARRVALAATASPPFLLHFPGTPQYSTRAESLVHHVPPQPANAQLDGEALQETSPRTWEPSGATTHDGPRLQYPPGPSEADAAPNRRAHSPAAVKIMAQNFR